MYSLQGLTHGFTRNADYVREHLSGMTHAQSLVQPPVAGNCVNWILGHIVTYRDYTLELLGQPALFGATAGARYDRGSAPITGPGEGVIDFDALMTTFNEAQHGILAAIPSLTQTLADEVVTQHGFSMRRGDLLMTWMRHESYHAGNLEMLAVWSRQA
jgi:DinB superfamily